MGQWAWAAPEAQELGNATASDVYALGLIILQAHFLDFFLLDLVFLFPVCQPPLTRSNAPAAEKKSVKNNYEKCC